MSPGDVRKRVQFECSVNNTWGSRIESRMIPNEGLVHTALRCHVRCWCGLCLKPRRRSSEMDWILFLQLRVVVLMTSVVCRAAVTQRAHRYTITGQILQRQLILLHFTPGRYQRKRVSSRHDGDKLSASWRLSVTVVQSVEGLQVLLFLSSRKPLQESGQVWENSGIEQTFWEWAWKSSPHHHVPLPPPQLPASFGRSKRFWPILGFPHQPLELKLWNIFKRTWGPTPVCSSMTWNY